MHVWKLAFGPGWTVAVAEHLVNVVICRGCGLALAKHVLDVVFNGGCSLTVAKHLLKMVPDKVLFRHAVWSAVQEAQVQL
jgi:hypothetical protein